MDVVDTMKKDKAYVKSKLIVKSWEKEFKIKNSRTPSKFDIKEAPSKIKYAYKKYFQLKSTALENSLSIGETEEDTRNSLEFLPEMLNSQYETNSPDTELLQALPSGQELEKLLSCKNSNSNESNPHPFTENLSKKLFLNRKFSLRNPRKFLLPKDTFGSQEKISKNNFDVDNKNSELILDTSTCTDNNSNEFVVEKSAKPEFLKSSLDSKQCISKTVPLRQLDISWLERAGDFTSKNLKLNSKENIEVPQGFGIGNITIPQVDKLPEYVENSESEDDIAIAKLKPALKKQKTISLDSIIQNKHTNESSSDNETLCDISKRLNKKKVSKVDIVINEKPKKNKNVNKSSKVLKEHQQEPPDLTEYIPFHVESDILPRYCEFKNMLKKVVSPKKSIKASESDQQKLENRIKDGTLNENFVKINIEKKVFVRGKKSINYSKYKKKQWKDKKALHAAMEFPEAGKILCFKCGQKGHMARYCNSYKGDALVPLENINDDHLPSLEEVKNSSNKKHEENGTLLKQLSNIYDSYQVPDSFIKLLAENPNMDCNKISPIYESYEQALSVDLYEDIKKFGYDSFRPGQEQSIKRILCGMSTLLILPTGGGKSLCYQLPAFIYSKYNKCITLVISPLVSLMEDQVLNVPDFLKAGCFHANQSPTQRNKIIECLKNRELDVLLISPEALISGDTTNGFSGFFKSLPPIAFACIDEVHCVSQWSHNFRPSYLMICRVLREKLKVKCILGLTATASQATVKSVISHLDIPDGINGVISNSTLPDNLHLSVSFESDKDRSLVSFLTSERIKSFNSVIVYCIRRDECERVATVLRCCLQDNVKTTMESQTKKRKRMSYIAEAYHAGMSAFQRKKIQKNFMNGTLRIIVATVAFGMGINKADIRCIIHYNMPSSFESYIQEVGRAGRDGKMAVCHVFMSDSNQDKNELLKHIHANSIDRPTIRKLLQRVFIPCECIRSPENCNVCKGHEVGIPIDSTVEELDLPAENIATLLCYIELNQKHIKLLNNSYVMCKISSFAGPQKIFEAAKSCQPLAMAILSLGKFDPNINNKSVIEFDVIEVASAVGWESGLVKYQLKNLEWFMHNGRSQRSHLKVEFHTLGFKIKARGDLTSTELDSILDNLHELVILQEKTRLYQLEECTKAFTQIGGLSQDNCNINEEEILIKTSNKLKDIIRNYFNRDTNSANDIIIEQRPLDEDRIKADVRSLVISYKDCNFNGRSIARIFQGISSPNYPAIIWGRTKYWRSHIHEDFNGVVKIATQQIIQMK